MSKLDLIFKVLTLLTIISSAILVYLSLKKSHRWNRRKATQDTLNNLIINDLSVLNKKMKIDLNIDIHKTDSDYSVTYNNLNEEEQKELNDTLIKAFNIFEIIAICIKNNIINENICYDYLALILTEYFRWGEDFIRQRCDQTHDPRVYLNFKLLAGTWRDRMTKELHDNLHINGEGRL